MSAAMLPGGRVLLEITLRTAAIYGVVVLFGVHLSGNREVRQMTPFDLLLISKE